MLEDSKTDAEIIQRLLKKENAGITFRLEMTEKGFHEALREFEPDVVLADNSLPQFNGTRALQIIRDTSPYIPFILVTGTVSEEFAAGIIKQGADDYILKDRLGRLPVAIDGALKQKRFEKEKHIAQQRLIESEENFRRLIERVSDGFIALDKEWRYTYANEKIGEMVHRDPRSLIGKNVWDVFPDAIGTPTYHAFHKAMAEQRYITNIDHYEPLGLWQENHIYPSADGVSVFIKDITEQKRAEQELHTAKDRLFFHVNNSPLGFVEWDSNLVIRSWSPRAREIFGLSQEEVMQLLQKPEEEKSDNSLYWLKDVAERLLTGDPSATFIQKQHYTKDNRRIWCEWFNSVTIGTNGTSIIMSLVQDITERKEAEERLRLSERILKEAQAIGHIGNWQVDVSTNKQSWSDELYRIFGMAPNEVPASRETFLSIVHPDDKERISKEIEEANKKMQDYILNFRIIRKDCQVRHVHSESKTEFNEQGIAVRRYGILQDVTESKEAELELQETNKQLHLLSGHLQEVREEERIHIAREIHDELGQQLTGLKMDISWLGKRIKTDDDAIKEKITSIISLLDETVKSVRRISSSLRPSILDDLGLIAALEWHSQEVEKRSEIKVNFNADIPEPDLSVSAATGIFRIYQEILTNAVRHANAHVINGSLRILNDRLLLAVQDDGRGMDQEQVKNKKTLGLIGMRERTFLLGGRFDLYSEPGKGTAIQVSIPLHTQE